MPTSLGPGVTRDAILVSKRVDGTDISIPRVTARGATAGPTLVVVGGVHGDEPEGPASVHDLLARLDPQRLRGTVVGIPVLNVPAYEARRRGNPLDDWFYDMNRIFPGNERGSLTQRIAHAMTMQIAPGADYIIAVHSGGNNIFCMQRVIVKDDASMPLARAMGPGWEIIAKGAGERASIADMITICVAGSTQGITLEYGGVNNRLPEVFRQQVRSVVDGIENAMRTLEMLEGTPRRPESWKLVAYEPIRNTHGGLLRATDAFMPGRQVKQGELLATIVDVYGDVVERVTAPYDGIMIAVPGVASVPHGGCQIGSIGRVLDVFRA